MVDFAAVMTPQSITFTKRDGATITLGQSHRWWYDVRDQLKKVQRIISEGGDLAAIDAARLKLDSLADPPKVIINFGRGELDVRHGVAYWRGSPLHGVIAERVLWMATEGFDIAPLSAFLALLSDNPSKRAVDQLYGFLDRHRMAITPDGHILAYKRVRSDFFDIHSGSFDNSPGRTVEMPRNRVDDDPENLCSPGLHFCAQSYLKHYGAGAGNKVVIVKVNPADVVSVPKDHDQAKVRCCRYFVVGEYTGSDLMDLLGEKAVMQENEPVRRYDGDDADELETGLANEDDDE